MERGEVYLVDFDPVVGSETGKTRLAIVLQNELASAPPSEDTSERSAGQSVRLALVQEGKVRRCQA